MFRPGLRRLREVREQTLSLVHDLTQEQLDQRLAQDSWSAGEILDHLIVSEKFLRKEIAELIERQRSGRATVLFRRLREFNISVGPIPRAVLTLLEFPLTVSSFFTPAFVRDFLISSRLVPARHPAVANPRHGRPDAELRAELAASIAETESLFEANARLDYRTLWHIHPLLGFNNVLDLLRIAALHEGRHQARLVEIVRSFRRAAAPALVA
jgi:hypothetical protein